MKVRTHLCSTRVPLGMKCGSILGRQRSHPSSLPLEEAALGSRLGVVCSAVVPLSPNHQFSPSWSGMRKRMPGSLIIGPFRFLRVTHSLSIQNASRRDFVSKSAQLQLQTNRTPQESHAAQLQSDFQGEDKFGFLLCLFSLHRSLTLALGVLELDWNAQLSPLPIPNTDRLRLS